MELLKSTKQERKDALTQLEKGVKDTKKEISQLKEEISQLTNENIGKITRRKNVRRTIARIKLAGNCLMVLGGLVALSCLLLFSIHVLLAALAIVAGAALAVYGMIVRKKWKAHENELGNANGALTDYDQQVAIRKEAIADKEATIQDYKAQIEAIKDFDKYEQFYRFEETCGRGYLLVFTTGNEDTTAKEPRPPKKRSRYNPDFLTKVEVFVDGVMEQEALPKKFDRQKGAFNLLAPEGSRFYTVASYLNATEPCSHTGQELCCGKKTPSQFIWQHISLYEEGVEVYTQDYDNLQDFMDAVGLTKDDLQEILE